MKTLYESILDDIDSQLKSGDDLMNEAQSFLEKVNKLLDNPKDYFRKYSSKTSYTGNKTPVTYHGAVDFANPFFKLLNNKDAHKKSVLYIIIEQYKEDQTYLKSQPVKNEWKIKFNLYNGASLGTGLRIEYIVPGDKIKTLKALIEKELKPNIFKDLNTCIEWFNKNLK